MSKRNVFDEVAQLCDKYGKLHERSDAGGDYALAEAYKMVTLDLCELITSKAGKS